MSKKILLLSTSPRRSGNTDSLCDAFAEGARGMGKDVIKLNINDFKIAPCMGCDACQKNGGQCVQKDDMAQILDIMGKADVVVFATPVYFYNMSGQMKVLLDRTYAQYKVFPFRKAALLAACADDAEGSFDTVKKGFEEYLRCLSDVECTGMLLVPGVYEKGTVAEEMLDAARALGQEI